MEAVAVAASVAVLYGLVATFAEWTIRVEPSKISRTRQLLIERLRRPR